MNSPRMLKASAFYPSVIQQIYSENKSLVISSYQEHLKLFFDKCFGWSDSWKLNLEKYHGYEVEEVIINAESLQRQWAKEHDISVRDENWLLDILEEQIKEFRPDIFFSHEFSIITPEYRRKIKSKYPFVKLIVGWNGINLRDTRLFEGMDLLLTNLSDTAEYYNQQGIQTHLVRMCFEESIIQRLATPHSRHQVTFVGGISLQNQGHYQRLKLLSQVAKKIDIDLWLSGISRKSAAFNVLMYLLNRNFEAFMRDITVMHDYCNLMGRSGGALYGLDMFNILFASNISFNAHIDAGEGKGGNMRMFEATGVGTCLVTDWIENIEDFFVPDQEVVTYRSADEAVDKIKYLMTHEVERKKIAQAGQARTLKDHTFKQMVSLVNDEFIRFL